jgi:predicted HAD superfamily Cof-like phosphohydrolase
MYGIIKSLEEFNERFEIDTSQSFEDVQFKDMYKLRYELMLEELNEYKEACEANDPVAVADAITDMLYILAGTMVHHKMPASFVHKLFTEVHRSNMSKLEDGKVLRREDGKILKGSQYSPPDLEKIVLNRKFK